MAYGCPGRRKGQPAARIGVVGMVGSFRSVRVVPHDDPGMPAGVGGTVCYLLFRGAIRDDATPPNS